jgi:transcriptional regulator with XRE-family HTH domain
MSDLAERIQARLDATGKNASSVADEIGANRSLVRDILVGKSKNPGVETIKAICGPLHCSIGFLLGIEEADAPEPPITKFWMVSGIGMGAPTYQHYSAEQAVSEAKRLAAKNPGTKFVVLEALQAFKAEQPRIVTIGITEGDDGDILF